MAVVLECFKRCRWECVDGVGSDELLDITDVTIARVLGACAGPQRPLHGGAACRQSLPFAPGKDLAKACVRETCIGDGCLAEQRFVTLNIASRGDPVTQQLVDGSVDAAHE